MNHSQLSSRGSCVSVSVSVCGAKAETQYSIGLALNLTSIYHCTFLGSRHRDKGSIWRTKITPSSGNQNSYTQSPRKDYT